MGEITFNADRTLKLVRSDNILRKVYGKRHPKGDKNEAVLKSVFNALVKGDRKLMALYQQIK